MSSTSPLESPRDLGRVRTLEKNHVWARTCFRLNEPACRGTLPGMTRTGILHVLARAELRRNRQLRILLPRSNQVPRRARPRAGSCGCASSHEGPLLLRNWTCRASNRSFEITVKRTCAI